VLSDEVKDLIQVKSKNTMSALIRKPSRYAKHQGGV
jgi:hypothetical protein